MNEFNFDTRLIEEKIKNPHFKYYYDLAIDTYEKVKPYLKKDKNIINYFLYVKINQLLEEDNKEIIKFSYDKYLLAEIITNNEEFKGLVDKLGKQIQEEMSNEKLNTILYQYFYMQYSEAMNLLKMIVRYFYLIDKYKNTPFSEELLKWLNSVNHYAQYKPIIFESKDLDAIEDKAKQTKAYKKCIEYYNIYFDYLYITNTLKNFIKGGEYNSDIIISNVQKYVLDYTGLIDIHFYLKIHNYKENKILKLIKDILKNSVTESKYIYNARINLEDILIKTQKKYNIDISLSEEEQKILKNKTKNAKNILNKYDYSKKNYISNFNTLTYLLSFNEETKKILQDTNTKLSIQDLEESEAKQDNITSSKIKISEDAILNNYTFSSYKYITFNTLSDYDIDANEDLTLDDYLKEREVKDYIEENKSSRKQRQDLPVKDKKKITKREKKVLDDNIGNYFNTITSRPYKLIENARGTLTTYEETNDQTIKIELKELREKLNKMEDKKKAKQLKEEIKEKEQELNRAIEQKQKAIKEKTNAEEYLQALYNDIKDIENKKSVKYKQLKKIIKEQEEKIKQYNKIIGSTGVFWQLDLENNGIVELKDKNNKITLSISAISKEMAKYTREAQDLALYINALYLQDTTNPHIIFSVKNYINLSSRKWNTRYKKQVYNSIRLLARERWTIYEEKVKGFHLIEIPLYGKLEIDENSKDGIIKLDITNDHIELMKNNGVLEYNKIDSRVFTLNNENEYYAKKLFIYINYLDRIEKSKDGVISKTIKSYIKELQYYGIKNYVLLNGDTYFKREIYDKITQAFSILEDKGAIRIDEEALSQVIDFIDNNKGKKTDTLIKNFENIKLPLTLLWRNYDYITEIATNTKRKNSKKKETTNKN